MNEQVDIEVLERHAGDIAAALRAEGFTAWWAGGYVRDRLLGRAPRDIDIATTATPDDIARIFPGAREVGRHFGVMLLVREGIEFEVATFRREGRYTDGRHPQDVAFCGPEEDARRRDFTVNGMFYDPLDGRVIDLVGGRADVEQRIIRTIGPPGDRFREDHLRLLRALRFSSVLEFSLEERTWSAIRDLAGSIARISKERIRDELSRILTEAPRPGDALVQLRDSGLLAVILPEVAAMDGQEQPPEFHPEGDVFTHTVIMLNRMGPEPDLELALAVLLHDIGKPPTAAIGPGADGCPRIRFDNHATVGARMAEALLRRLAYPRHLSERVAYCIHNHMRFRDVQAMRPAKLRRFVAAPTFPTELHLHRLDCLSSHGMLDNYHFLQRVLKELDEHPALPPCLINGRDLLALGFPEGPQIGYWLRRAHDYQMEHPGAVSREDLLDWVLAQHARADRSGEDEED
jgi:putative nucleotidyltransferase with HDIG domain